MCLKREEKITDKPVKVVKKCPDIPVAALQYTFTHKQYTEQHNDTEYTERNIHNNNTIKIHNIRTNNLHKHNYIKHTNIYTIIKIEPEKY
jgi:hypothetical protein